MPQALLLDLNGVLFEDGVALPGAVEGVARARAQGLILRFVINTATRSDKTLLNELRGMGFTVAKSELFTAPLAARAYLMRHGLRPHCLVHPAIEATFEDLRGPTPNAVVLGDARDGLSYAALNQVFRLVRTGLPLIGLGMNRCFREGGEWMLDAGPFIRAIAWAADTEAVVMGKPSSAFYRELVASTGLEPGACLMVGDDVDADVAGAIASGLRGCLVRSGKFQPGDLERLPAGATQIGNLTELAPLLG